jgi:hypothetical protein
VTRGVIVGYLLQLEAQLERLYVYARKGVKGGGEHVQGSQEHMARVEVDQGQLEQIE